MNILKDINNIDGIKALAANGGEIFLVGGIVRDSFLGKESKDIDLIVRLLQIDDIEKILLPHGFVKKDVGKSFSVIKFIPHGWTKEPIDIALPRTEKKVGVGHKGFEIDANPFLKIEEDLIRRDITINSIAIALKDGRVIDPFNGILDIKNKLIKATSNQSFIEDPLRILRVIQFASRFGFDIEDETFNLILKNVQSLDEISGERIITELDKIFTKGDIQKGFQLLKDSKVLKQITGVEPIDFQLDSKLTRSEFFFLMFQGSQTPELIFEKRLKGDVDTIKGIKALSIFRNKFTTDLSEIEKRFLIVELITKSNDVLDFTILKGLETEIAQFKNKEFPSKITDLAVNGDILKTKGLKEGKEIGDKLKLLLSEVIQGKKKNNIEDLLND